MLFHDPGVAGQADQVEEHQRQHGGVDPLGGDGHFEQVDARKAHHHRRDQELAQEEKIERLTLFVRRVQAAGEAEEFREGVGGRQGYDDDAHETGVEDADGKQLAGQRPREGLDGQGGLLAGFQYDAVHEQGGRGGNHHEEGKKVCQERAQVGFDLRIAQVAFLDFLVEGKTADEELPPRGDGGSQDAQPDDQVAAHIFPGKFNAVRINQVAERQPPVRFSLDGRDDVGQVEQAGKQHHRLGELVVAAGDEEEDQDDHDEQGGDGRQVENVCGGANGSHVADDRAHIGDQEGDEDYQRNPDAEFFTDEIGQPAPRHDGQAHAHLLRYPQQDGDDAQREENGIAQRGTGDGIGGDARGVVIGHGGDGGRAENRQENQHAFHRAQENFFFTQTHGRVYDHFSGSHATTGNSAAGVSSIPSG